MPNPSLDERCINTLRFLAVDAVEEAGSGHPGMPLGAAPMAYVLWDRFLKHNPENPGWPNRDRFVLSAGHGSALLYALLHLYGYDLPLDEVKNFRQLHSKTPGHPEYRDTPGVETTTGPLGQGFANGVGMALAERYLSGTFNTDEHDLVDHYTYGIVSDGDLMEGISAEAGALAGHLGLGKLIYLYDQNCISIEGETDLAFTERVASRFDAQGWHVQHVEDGTDLDDIEAAIEAAQEATERPSIICVHTHIGHGSPQQDTAGVHGSPLGEDDLTATKERLGWPTDERFHMPEDVYEHCRRAIQEGAEQETAWQNTLEKYREAHPDSCRLFLGAMDGEVPEYEADQVATGSEVHLARDAAATLAENDVAARVVSMPSMERFEDQPSHYRHDVLPPDVPTVAVEAGTTRGWHHLVGDTGTVLGLDRFGLSGPGEEVYEELGFTVDRVVDAVHEVLEPASESAAPAS